MPIEFSLPLEARLAKKMAERFVENEIMPIEEEMDKYFKENPRDVLEKAAKAGLMGLSIPKKYGGAGLGEVGYCAVMEEIGGFSSSMATVMGAHLGLGTMALYLFGNEEQRKKYLPKLTKGEYIAAFGLTEDQAGSDAANVTTVAKREGDEWVVNGRKIFITNGDIADIVILFAMTDKSLGAGGISAFILETDTPGFSVGSHFKKMGIRGSATVELILEDVRIPHENLLGQINRGFIYALITLDGGRATVSCGACGGMKRVLNFLIDYTNTAKRRGMTLANYQQFQWAVADIAATLRTARFFAYHTAKILDEYFTMVAERKPIPRPFRELVTRDSALSKMFASEGAGLAFDRVMQLVGSIGYVEGYTIERAFRDSIIAEIYEGTNEIQRYVAGRELLRRGRWFE
ncbi:MAG: acyl-CoA dehydrogenase family protein [Candidatus Njordarchaeia archaeon]